MKTARTSVSIVALGLLLVACSAAPEAPSTSDEALKGCGIDCGGGDPGSPPTPTSGGTCPSVNSICQVSYPGWGVVPDWYTLASAGCNAPIHWWIPQTGEYLALCPRTTAVANWVATHAGAEEVYACDACLGVPGRNSVWVRIGYPFHEGCGPIGCSPNCPSGCRTW